jgi:uncharacterized membrane protein (UPF0136 family)
MHIECSIGVVAFWQSKLAGDASPENVNVSKAARTVLIVSSVIRAAGSRFKTFVSN